jgi:hypothetical protein
MNKELMNDKTPNRFTKVWVLFDRHHSPGPVPYATLGPIDQSVPYVPEESLEKLRTEASELICDMLNEDPGLLESTKNKVRAFLAALDEGGSK